MTDVVTPGDLDQSLASLAPTHRLLPLMLRELQLAPEPNSSLLRTLPPFVSPRKDQMPLKLSQATQHSHH
jgi:hypothetical protein